VDGINNNVENSPATVNALNSFSISVKANLFNTALEYPLTFDKLSLGLALSVDNLTAGDVSIQIYNDSKQMLYNKDFSQKASLAETITLQDRPTKVKFIFNSLTANFSCAFAGK